jgi:hypothetical protein
MIKIATTSAPSELSCNGTSISSTPMAPFDSPTAKSYLAAKATARCHSPRVAEDLVIGNCSLSARRGAWSAARMGLCTSP